MEKTIRFTGIIFALLLAWLAWAAHRDRLLRLWSGTNLHDQSCSAHL
jgi:hypothetical protein